MTARRSAVFAGRFYPAGEEECLRTLRESLRDVDTEAAAGAIVPHAGWIFSGATAALSWAGIAAGKPDTVVVFGAVHTPDANEASVFAAGSWDTPLGPLGVDEELAAQIVDLEGFTNAPQAHRNEHSIEVQLPFVKYLLPEALVVPISVRPGTRSAQLGQLCAEQAAGSGKVVAFVGSTDLTHYGPAFGFEPHGRGRPGIRWAKEVNDRRLIGLIERMDAEGVVSAAAASHNACGSGAIAATIGAMERLGRGRYLELRHTCSAECEAVGGSDPYNSVGYEAGVFLAE